MSTLPSCRDDIRRIQRGLETHHPDIASQISDYRDIIGFRIVLVHRYSEIRNQELWEIIQHKLPTLLKETTALLEQP